MICKTCGEFVARPTFGEIQNERCTDCANAESEAG